MVISTHRRTDHDSSQEETTHQPTKNRSPRKSSPGSAGKCPFFSVGSSTAQKLIGFSMLLCDQFLCFSTLFFPLEDVSIVEAFSLYLHEKRKML